ncbi:ClpS-like protein [Serendipita vermifera]|nr:ClpS-like protein [Serendipita vermifera]
MMLTVQIIGCYSNHNRQGVEARVSFLENVKSKPTETSVSYTQSEICKYRTPPPAGDAKINKLVDDIASLSLLQAADLVSLLKTRLNITEIALPAASAAPVATAPAVEEEPAPQEVWAIYMLERKDCLLQIEQEKPKEKTMFTLRLESFNADSKAKVIREVKATFANMNLMEAKKFAESVPQTLKENVPKEEAEKLKAAFEALGAKVTLE